jgi:hypothetical protein
MAYLWSQEGKIILSLALIVSTQLRDEHPIVLMDTLTTYVSMVRGCYESSFSPRFDQSFLEKLQPTLLNNVFTDLLCLKSRSANDCFQVSHQIGIFV